MKRIFNLTATRLGRVVDSMCRPRTTETTAEIISLLMFNDPPGAGEVAARSRRLAEIAFNAGATEAIISGDPSPWMIEALPAALRMRGIQPIYIFPKRDVDGLTYFGGFVKL